MNPIGNFKLIIRGLLVGSVVGAVSFLFRPDWGSAISFGMGVAIGVIAFGLYRARTAAKTSVEGPGDTDARK